MKTDDVDRIYSHQARFYERTHRWIFGGWDTSWRQVAAWICPMRGGAHVVDLCTGQGHAAVEYLKVWTARGFPDVRVTGVDINAEMLEAGRQRITFSPFADRIRLVQGDVMRMRAGSAVEGQATFPDQPFDAALSVFGIGGIEDVAKAFREMIRIVKAGSPAAVLDSQLPAPGLHPIGPIARLLLPLRRAMMRRLWGWEDRGDFFEEIEKSRYEDAERRIWRLRTELKLIVPVPGFLRPKAIAIYLGTRVEDGAVVPA
jgi:ubiquinone/menaquinone biosynthesis C-methylase UbiE